jgi:methyl-accepting chemotaxis protein
MQRRGLPFLIASVFVVLLAVLGTAHLLVTNLLASAHEGDYALMRAVLAASLKSAEEGAVTRAELLETTPSVHNTFVERDRPKLASECEQMFKVQKERYGLERAQFHTPPGVSFLRLHDPKKFGDEQASYRPMLAEVHQTKSLRRGMEISRAGPSITAITPIINDKKEFVGSFEIGLAIGPVLDKIKDGFNLEGAFYIDEKILKDIATGMPPDTFSATNRVGRFIRLNPTHPELIAELVTDKEVDVNQATSYERTVRGEAWGVQLVPLYNYSHKQIGVVALGTSFAADKSAIGRARVWMSLVTVFAIVILCGLILIVVRGLLLRPIRALGDRMTALAQNKADSVQPADDLDSYCDEVRVIAQAYETIRKERSGE